MLEVADVEVRFGGVVALHDPSFEVPRGKICGLIGPNGAGKTTLFNCITRLYTPSQGVDPLRGRGPARPARRTSIPSLGIARTFQNLGLIPSMTVRENVMLGAHHRGEGELPHRRARAAAACARRSASCAADADEILERLGLTHIADRPAAGLPYGTLKRVELARAICLRPKLLLLDEPASGLAHSEVDALSDLLVELREALRPDDPARRAPHGHGHAHLRPRRGAQLRPAHRRRAAPRTSSGTRRSSRPTWGRANEPARGQRPRGRLRPGLGAARPELQRRGGRDRHHPRPQRRGQDDHAARAVRHGPLPREDHASTARASSAGRPTAPRATASPTSPRAAGRSPS